MKFFGKKNKDEKSRSGVLVTVMSADPAFVVIEDFQITIAEAIGKILKKLNLPVEANAGIKMKYFLYRTSDKTDDGFEILAEIDLLGEPCILSKYGVVDKAELYLGAIMLPKTAGKAEAENAQKENDDNKAGDDDFEVETEDAESSSDKEEYFEI
jgi:hypothetical protein